MSSCNKIYLVRVTELPSSQGLVPCLSVSDELVDGSQLLPILDSAVLGLLSSTLLITKLTFASKDLVPPHETTFGLNYGSRAAWHV